MGSIDVGYGGLSKLPFWWFRLWLLIHHPRSPDMGIPWLWWLSAGLIPALPWEFYTIHSSNTGTPNWTERVGQKVHRRNTSTLSRMWRSQPKYRPWITLYLNQLSKIALRVITGARLDPQKDWVVMKRDLNRLPHHRGSSLVIRKWSRVFRLYDRVSRIMAQQRPLLFPVMDAQGMQTNL